ncbi:hypothetical protein ACLKA6_003270 [Drosophila palustris]
MSRTPSNSAICSEINCASLSAILLRPLMTSKHNVKLYQLTSGLRLDTTLQNFTRTLHDPTLHPSPTTRKKPNAERFLTGGTKMCWLLAAPNAEPQTAVNVGCGPRYDYPSVAALRLPASGELATF